MITSKVLIQLKWNFNTGFRSWSGLCGWSIITK